MQLTEKSRQFNKDRFDTLSIPGYVFKKNQSRGPGHGPSMCHQARDMWRRAKLPKISSCQTILERWYRDNKYCKSLFEEGWTEEQIRQYDELQLEDHSHEATPGERRRWEKNWHIVFNKEGKQGPMRQRPDFREAKHAYRQLFKERAESTGEGAPQTRQNYRQRCEGSEDTCTVHPRTGWTYYLSTSSPSSLQ